MGSTGEKKLLIPSATRDLLGELREPVRQILRFAQDEESLSRPSRLFRLSRH